MLYSQAVYESHKLEDNLSLNIKHLRDCEDLFIGLKQKVRCFQFHEVRSYKTGHPRNRLFGRFPIFTRTN